MGKYHGLWARENQAGWSGKAPCPSCEHEMYVNLYENTNDNPKAPVFDVVLNPVKK